MHYIVFLDTNIFDASNYNFHNELFTKLYDYVNRGIIELQISSVVKGEVSRHIYDKVKKRIEEINLNISSRDLKIFRNDSDCDRQLKKYNSEVWVSKALQIFSDFLVNCKTTILLADNINTESILYDYFNCQPPFEKEKKEEFPDAISLAVISKEISKLSNGNYFYNYKNAFGTSDDLLYCIISNDNGFRKAAERIASNRPNEDIVILKSMQELFRLITIQDEQAKSLQDKLSHGFAKDIIEETIQQAIECAAFNIDEDDGYVEDYVFLQANNIQYEANVISYQKMSDGNDVARIYVDTMFDVRIQYEFLNSNESLWDKEEQDFIVRVTTEKTADFRVESSIVFNLKIDCNQNVEFLEYIETPTDIDIQTYDMIEVISYKNKYPF